MESDSSVEAAAAEVGTTPIAAISEADPVALESSLPPLEARVVIDSAEGVTTFAGFPKEARDDEAERRVDALMEAVADREQTANRYYLEMKQKRHTPARASHGHGDA